MAAARAMWRGVLAFGRERLPVKLYAAVTDRKVHFHLLHDSDLVRVEQRMVDPETGKPVPSDEIRKGLEVAPGTFVALDDEELASLDPEGSREIEVTRFVPVGAIEQPWYDRPYWLGPDGDDDAYFALVAALRKQEREGVARWTMRKRRYVGALRAEGDHLALIALRHAGEVVLSSELPSPGGRDLDARERKLAEQLVSALEEAFDATEYEDTYRTKVRALVNAKAKGKPVKMPKARAAPKEAASLEDALAASLAKAKEKGGRRRAG